MNLTHKTSQLVYLPDEMIPMCANARIAVIPGKDAHDEWIFFGTEEQLRIMLDACYDMPESEYNIVPV